MLENNYLGTEKLGKLLAKFAVPCICSLIISCLYNIVDQIFVGNMVGYVANGATGIIFPITVIGWGISLLFGDGAAASLSMSLGKNETADIHRSVGNSILFSFLGGVVIIVISYLWGDNLLWLIGATEDNIVMAHNYGFIIYAMIPLALAQNCMAAIIRADGSPSYAMGAMIVGAVMNIIGDPVLIHLMGNDIRGAAIATIISQFVSFLICAAYMARSKSFRLSLNSFRPDFRLLRRNMALGSSSFLTQFSIVVITILNNILLVRYGMLSDYGMDIPLSAFVVLMKLFQIVLNIAIGIAAGAQPIVGFNFGARKYGRVKSLLKMIIGSTAVICILCTIFFEAIPQVFILMFGAQDDRYLQFAELCLRIYLSLITFTCVQKVCAIFLQSIGHAKQAAPLSLLRDILLIIFTLGIPMLMAEKDRVTGIFWAAPMADVLAILITAAVMLHLWRELTALERSAQPEAEEAVLHPTREGVVITIAREHGSAGKYVGQLVAQKLGIPCYYKEMTALAAQESGLAKEFISDLNSNEHAVMKELYLSTHVVQQAIMAQDKVIKQIADAGSCVIVGRAADYVLRGRDNVVRIFIHAPKDYRVKKVMEMYGDSEQEGRKNIVRSDSARAAYYKNISGLEWGDARQYELSVDSSIGPEKTAELICDYIQRL